MAKKIMLWPSARSKYVKEQNMKLIFKMLLLISAVLVITNWYMYGFMYGIKLALMVAISLVVVKETEILFYSHDKNIDREEAKKLIEKSYPEFTAMVYVLLIPIGIPLWLTAIGAVLATLLGKLLFGGFAHQIFNSGLVGVIFVTEGWSQLVSGVSFSTGFDNYVLTLLFDNSFFNDTLSIGNIFNPDNYVTALEAIKDGSMYNLGDVMLGIVPGVTVSAALLMVVGGYLLFKKAIDWKLPVIILGSFTITAFIIGIVQNQEPLFAIYHIMSGSFLFVLLFVATDPITTPIDIKGKLIFGIIAGALAMFIRNGIKYEEGIIFGVMFMMMLTPMLNQTFSAKKKKPIKKAPVQKEAA